MFLFVDSSQDGSLTSTDTASKITNIPTCNFHILKYM